MKFLFIFALIIAAIVYFLRNLAEEKGLGSKKTQSTQEQFYSIKVNMTKDLHFIVNTSNDEKCKTALKKQVELLQSTIDRNYNTCIEQEKNQDPPSELCNKVLDPTKFKLQDQMIAQLEKEMRLNHCQLTIPEPDLLDQFYMKYTLFMKEIIKRLNQ